MKRLADTDIFLAAGLIMIAAGTAFTVGVAEAILLTGAIIFALGLWLSE